jgi:hypothetical protein
LPAKGVRNRCLSYRPRILNRRTARFKTVTSPPETTLSLYLTPASAPGKRAFFRGGLYVGSSSNVDVLRVWARIRCSPLDLQRGRKGSDVAKERRHADESIRDRALHLGFLPPDAIDTEQRNSECAPRVRRQMRTVIGEKRRATCGIAQSRVTRRVQRVINKARASSLERRPRPRRFAALAA